MVMPVMIHGFLMSLGLIVAIGAQNAFVLKQGLVRQHIFWICLLCAVSDAILIFAGVYGFGHLLKLFPEVLVVAKCIGVVFLFVYGLLHFIQAYKAEQSLRGTREESSSLWKSLLICLGLTWLNPHVYLDTVLLIGAVAAQFQPDLLQFALGASLASMLFFFGLGYGAAYLQPLFQQPRAWQVLDVLIGIVMWVIAMQLIWN